MTKKSPQDFVKNLKAQQIIESHFAIVNKNLRTSASGRNYLDLTLTDKSGEIKGRMFPEKKVEELFDSINTGCICKIEGRVNEFPPNSNQLNIIINSLTELDDNEYVLNDFVRTSDNNHKELTNEIITTIKSIQNPLLKNLLKNLFL